MADGRHKAKVDEHSALPHEHPKSISHKDGDSKKASLHADAPMDVLVPPEAPIIQHAIHQYYEDDDKEDSDDEPQEGHEHEHGDEHVEKKPEELHHIIVHKRAPNLESVLTYQEEVTLGEERHFADSLDAAFAPCRIFMLTLFRFPLLLVVRKDYSREFAYSWKSFRGCMFFITGGLLCLNCLLIVIGLGVIMLDEPGIPASGYTAIWDEGSLIDKAGKLAKPLREHKSQKELRIEELYLLQRNFVPMTLLVLTLIHVCAGDVSLFFKREFVAKYFTFWDEAVEIMKMDVGKYPDDVRKYLIRVTVFYICFLIIFLGLCAGRIAPVATGGPTQLVILWARPVYQQIHAWQYLHYYRWAGIVVYIYILMCSKVYILLLLYKCKILKNAYATWNERLATVIHKDKSEEKRPRKYQCEHRVGFDHLFRDYVVLLNLLKGADTMFTNVVESYFATQVFSLCFEVYYFMRTFSAHEEFRFARKADGILVGIYLFHSVIMLLLTTHASAEVGEVAMEGLEIIRRNGCIGRKSNDEMYFTLSLYMSYTGHFETALTAGKFVTFDRSFIVSLVGTIFAYYIILSQFTPPLAMSDQDKLDVINPKNLILHVENTFPINSDLKVGYDTLRNNTVFPNL